MLFTGRFILSALTAMFLLAFSGCSPMEQSAADEEKEPHFVLASSRFNSMDYTGAIEAFQESLEVNPRSAQAHYRLGQLFDTKQPDPAAAIFHYQEYLRLNKNAENAELISRRITDCKQQLAADVMAMPTTPRAMRQIEELTETNRLLQAQVEQLRESVKKWSDYADSLKASARNNSAPQNNFSATPNSAIQLPDDTTLPPATVERGTTPFRVTPLPPPRTRTYVVKSGETLASIARKQGVSLSALQGANPGVNPKKIRKGQTLNLP
jgi:LysM repeat protein